MKIGVYGGTFDPVHFGHLILAETCREICNLDAVWFMPAAVPPHKLNETITPARQRIEMLKFAIAGNSRFRISTLELDRKGPSFTVDTLTQMKKEIPDAELFLLIGADSLDDFPTWREPLQILNLATVVAVNRGRHSTDIEPFRAALGDEAAQQVLQVQMPAVDFSSTDLRARAAAGRSIRYLTPQPVAMYLQQQGLYRDAQ